MKTIKDGKWGGGGGGGQNRTKKGKKRPTTINLFKIKAILRQHLSNLEKKTQTAHRTVRPRHKMEISANPLEK